MSRYVEIVEDKYGKQSHFKIEKMVMDGGIAFALLLASLFFWPFSSVPTGSRGVLTQFGAIKVIEPEGLEV